MWQPTLDEWIEAFEKNEHLLSRGISILLFFVIMIVAFGLSLLEENPDLHSVLYHLVLGFYAWYISCRSMLLKKPYIYIIKENGIWVLGEPHPFRTGYVYWESVMWVKVDKDNNTFFLKGGLLLPQGSGVFVIVPEDKFNDIKNIIRQKTGPRFSRYA